MSPNFNTVIQGDCIEALSGFADPIADLIFADPPFNIGYKYDVYEDRRKYDEFYNWTHRWMDSCLQVLKPTGSFWVAIGDDYAAEVRMIGRRLGLHLRNWVIWHYTFGQQTKMKFARSHTHLFYFVKDPKTFTFNDKAVRTFSDRQRVYKDRRANQAGKMPDDVWSEFPRLCGTFAERAGWHPCQMPETVLARIVRVSSNPGDLVLDPFAGSGTTLVAAKRLRRRYLGIELSESYAEQIKARLADTVPADPGKRRTGGAWPEGHVQDLMSLYLEAAVSTDMLYDNPVLMEGFAQQLNWRIALNGESSEYSVAEVWDKIESLRRQTKLGRVRIHADNTAAGKARPYDGPLFRKTRARRG